MVAVSFIIIYLCRHVEIWRKWDIRQRPLLVNARCRSATTDAITAAPQICVTETVQVKLIFKDL